jgi:hypothetical protein
MTVKKNDENRFVMREKCPKFLNMIHNSMQAGHVTKANKPICGEDEVEKFINTIWRRSQQDYRRTKK